MESNSESQSYSSEEENKHSKFFLSTDANNWW